MTKGGSTRDAILRAAVEVFGEEGVAGARTTDIARRAGVSQPSINYHFGSKRELLSAALEEAGKRWGSAARIDPAIADMEPLDVLRFVLRGLVRMVVTEPEITRFVYRVVGREAAQAELAAGWQPMGEGVSGLLDRLAAEGTIREVPLPYLFRSIVDAVAVATILPLDDFFERPFSDEAERLRYGDHIIETVLAGLRP